MNNQDKLSPWVAEWLGMTPAPKNVINKMRIVQALFEVEVPPGKYFIGDPCYSVPDHLWHPLLDSCNYFQNNPIGEVEGLQVLAFSTAHGDGEYTCRGNFIVNGERVDSIKLGVDAGMIGLVPVTPETEAELVKYGTRPAELIEFKYKTICRETARGVMEFGSYQVNTDYDEDEEY